MNYVELLPVLNKLSKLSEKQLKKVGLTLEERLMVEILTDPVKWAREYLGWEARDYQENILQEGAKRNRLVLRLGRRLGKTECMCILILWHAFTQINRDFDKADTDPYDILILTPYESQAKMIHDRVKELIEASPELKKSVKRNVFLRTELNNNTNIQLMTVGANSGNGGANTRGERADLIIYDEIDYIPDDSITNTYNIRNEDPTRIKVIAASTPSGDRRMYYKWCTGATHRHHADINQIEKTGEIKYKYEKNRDGNGWTEVYAPSTVNKKLMVINPDTGKTGLDELREEFTEMRYLQEVMAEFGESETGVYQKKFIDRSVEKGRKMDIQYASDLYGRNMQDFRKVGKRILGVDWDTKGNPTNMVGLHFIEEYGVFVPFVRVEIPQTEYTYDVAVKKIIQLNEVYNFDWIYADAGAGEFQIQYLKKYGMENPASGLHHKVVRVNFSEKIEWRDPFTMQKQKVHIKPFMVENTVRAFERGQIVLNPDDKLTIQQFQDYHIVRWGLDGRPVYTDENEHIHDCIILAMHGFIEKYSDMLKVNTTVAISQLKPLELGSGSEVASRDIPEEPEERPSGVATMVGLGTNKKRTRMSGRRNMGMPSRKRF